MKIRLWLYKYNIFELRINKWNWEWSAQSWTLLIKAVVKMKPEKKMRVIFLVTNTTLAVLETKPEKSSGLYGSWTSVILVQCFTNRAIKPTGSSFDIHIFSVVYLLLHRFITNQKKNWFPVSLLAQLVEHGTGIAEVMVPTSVQALIFFRLYFHFC